MKLSGKFKSSNEQCPITGHRLNESDENKAVVSETEEHGFIIKRMGSNMYEVSVTALAEGGATSLITFTMDVVDLDPDPYLTIAVVELAILLLMILFVYWRCVCKK